MRTADQHAVLPPVTAAQAAAVNRGRGRTLYQDPAFGPRQLAGSTGLG